MYQDINVVKNVPPEEEYWKSIYISGSRRKNHKGIIEIPGKLQIRGHSYNHDKLNMIVLFIKQVNVKTIASTIDPTKKILDCFSYRDSKPFKGTSGLLCNKATEFCKNCRTHIIVAGILTDSNGDIILDDNKKPLLVFIRGKGVKYASINNYFQELYNYDPLLGIYDDEEKERLSVNTRRFVVEIEIGLTETKFGEKEIFELKRGKELSKEQIKNLIELSMKLVDKFDSKFNWSKNKNNNVNTSEDEKSTTISNQPTTSNQPASQSTNQSANRSGQKGFNIDIDSLLDDNDVPF